VETMAMLEANRVGAAILRSQWWRLLTSSVCLVTPIFLTAAAEVEGRDPPKPLPEAHSNVQDCGE